jgi:hypothetical protein
VSPQRRRRSNASRSNQSRAQPRRRRAQGRAFWGPEDPEEQEVVEATIRPIADPTALVASLGPPPLPGHETAAQHYFAAVYDRAANLAVALAAASELLAPPEDD